MDHRHRHLFIITSVVNTRTSSVYTPKERALQILGTVASIRKYDAHRNPLILLVEGSQYNWNDPTINHQLDVDHILYVDVVEENKSVGESILLRHAVQCDWLRNHPDIRDQTISRIFKLSGRYYLDDTFNPELHDLAHDKIGVKTTRKYSCHDQPVVFTALFSWPPVLNDFMADRFEYVERQVRTCGRDIEHWLLYDVSRETMVHEVDPLGVDGPVTNGDRYASYF